MALAFDLSAHDSLIVTLYVNEKLPCYKIAEILKEKEGLQVSNKPIEKYLRGKGLIRTKSEARLLSKIKHKKICKGCSNEFLPKCGIQVHCKDCIPNNETAGSRFRRYGITQIAYDEIIKRQKNACALCERSFETFDSKQIHIDHCHKTGVVRGLLCSHCNASIAPIDRWGLPWVQRALTYLNVE